MLSVRYTGFKEASKEIEFLLPSIDGWINDWSVLYQRHGFFEVEVCFQGTDDSGHRYASSSTRHSECRMRIVLYSPTFTGDRKLLKDTIIHELFHGMTSSLYMNSKDALETLPEGKARDLLLENLSCEEERLVCILTATYMQDHPSLCVSHSLPKSNKIRVRD